MRLLLACSARARRSPTTSRRHPEQWRELTDPTLGDPPRGVRPPRGDADRGRRRPARRRARGGLPDKEARGRAAGGVPPAPAAAGLARPRPPRRSSTTPPPSSPTWRRATLDAALAVARARVGEPARAVPPRGHRDGQVRRPRAQLRLRRRRDLRRTSRSRGSESGPTARTTASPCGRPPSWPRTLMRVCSDHTREGTIWPVDANLRPEGKSGPARAHARQPPGLLRALGEDLGVPGAAQGASGGRRPRPRPASTSRWSGRWCGRAAERDGFVEEVQAMRRRVLDHIPAHQAERQLKLGSGGLRDVEFAVQLLQMVHGRTDEEVRPPTTLSALARADRGRLRRPRGRRALHDAYAFLRTLEHRIQLHQLRRTHVMPEDEASLRRLGRSLGYTKEPGRRARQAVAATTSARCAGCTRSSSTARCSPPWPGSAATRRGSRPEAAGPRLSALGYEDPKAALRHLEALTAGVTPDGADPAHAAAGDARVVRRRARPGRGPVRLPPDLRGAGRTPWYLRLLRDEGEVAQRMAQVLGDQPLRHRPARARAAGRGDPRRAGAPRAADPRGRADRDDVGRRAARRRPGGGRRDPVRSAGASCCGSASPTCACRSGSPRWATR